MSHTLTLLRNGQPTSVTPRGWKRGVDQITTDRVFRDVFINLVLCDEIWIDEEPTDVNDLLAYAVEVRPAGSPEIVATISWSDMFVAVTSV